MTAIMKNVDKVIVLRWGRIHANFVANEASIACYPVLLSLRQSNEPVKFGTRLNMVKVSNGGQKFVSYIILFLYVLILVLVDLVFDARSLTILMIVLWFLRKAFKNTNSLCFGCTEQGNNSEGCLQKNIYQSRSKLHHCMVTSSVTASLIAYFLHRVLVLVVVYVSVARRKDTSLKSVSRRKYVSRV